MDVPNATPETEQPQVDAQVEAPQAATPMQVQPQSPESGQPPQPQAPPPPSPEQQAAMASQAHDTFIGKAAKMLLGNTTSYQVDPASGQMVATQAPQQPGALFRNILAGAILGGALGQQAGARPGGGPAAAALAGAGGAMQQAQGQDDAKKAAAQGQFQDQMKAQQNQREQAASQRESQEADQQEILRKAQLAHTNLTTMQLHNEIMGKDKDRHEELAVAGRANTKTYTDSGVKPVFEGIPESQMAEIIKKYPGASALDWTHTGTVDGDDVSNATGLKVERTGEKLVDDANGGHYESTFTAFDPKTPVNLSSTTLSQWKKDGFLDSLPGSAKDVLKTGMPLQAAQFVALKDQHEKFQLEDQKQKTVQHALNMMPLQEQAEQAGTAEKRSGTAKNYAEANKANAEAKATADGGDVDAQAQMLINHEIAPSQLSKRAKTYGAILERAKQLDQNFDPAASENQYKYANTPATQSTLKYVSSLTGTGPGGGNLGDLVRLSNSIPRTSLPALNDAAAWAKMQTGNVMMARYHTAALEVADQAAKILQGGGSGSGTSDAKLKQASDMFNTGFSSDQIAGVADTLGKLLSNRKVSMIRGNKYLEKSYPDLPVGVVNEHGVMGKVPLGKLDTWLAANKQRKEQ